MSRSGASSEGDVSSSGDAGKQVPSRAPGDELEQDSAAADAVATAKVLCSVSYLVFTGAKLLLLKNVKVLIKLGVSEGRAHGSHSHTCFSPR